MLLIVEKAANIRTQKQVVFRAVAADMRHVSV